MNKPEKYLLAPITYCLNIHFSAYGYGVIFTALKPVSRYKIQSWKNKILVELLSYSIKGSNLNPHCLSYGTFLDCI